MNPEIIIEQARKLTELIENNKEKPQETLKNIAAWWNKDEILSRMK